MFNQKLIESIGHQIIVDEYSEVSQKESKGMPPFSQITLDFTKRNLNPGKSLEIGGGSGQSTEFFSISNILEPCEKRANNKKNSIYGFCENIPAVDKSYSNVLMLDTFDQIRSTMETLAEINRVLVEHGVFIFDCQVEDSLDIVYGVVYGFRNLRRYVEDFGFQVVEARQIDGRGLYCFEKEFDWTPKMLSKLQIVKENSIWVAKNFHPEEPFHRKYL